MKFLKKEMILDFMLLKFYFLALVASMIKLFYLNFYNF